MRRNGPEPVEGPIFPWSNVMPAWFYILRLHSGTLYLGATMNLEERYKDHLTGKACRTSKVDSPVALVYSEKFETNVEARRREAQVKRWSRAKKEALVSGDMSKLRELSKSREDM
jgi:putative endonuclease